MNNAIEFATKKHEGQRRKFSDLPYITHPLSVMSRLKEYTNDEDLLIAAVLHDTLEDTDTSFDEISLLFGGRVANLVLELTSNEKDILSTGRDVYERGSSLVDELQRVYPDCTTDSLIRRIGKVVYLQNHLSTMSSDALLIKLADRLDNVSGPSEGVFKSLYTWETYTLLNNLDRSDLTEKHQALISSIRDILSSN